MCISEDMHYKHSSPPVAVSCQISHAGLPVRYIQHCQLTDLYWQMQAEWDVLAAHLPSVGACPSYKTFSRRYQSTWKKMLVMRKSSQHSQCRLCFDLQQVLASKTARWADKLQAARMLKSHQREQYHDRLLYWSLRFASKVNNDVLVIIIDDMDHSKFAWPRFGFRKQTHDLDNLTRPTVTFTGALAHGFGTYLYMAGPQVAGGSDYFLEILCQTLEFVFLQTRRPTDQEDDEEEPSKPRKQLPSHLVVVADNTVKSAKNQFVLKFLALLVQRQLFKSATLFHLMVGHTHEDIDQLFALITALLQRKQTWETPDEVLEHLASCVLSEPQSLNPYQQYNN